MYSQTTIEYTKYSQVGLLLYRKIINDIANKVYKINNS